MHAPMPQAHGRACPSIAKCAAGDEPRNSRYGRRVLHAGSSEMQNHLNAESDLQDGTMPFRHISNAVMLFATGLLLAGCASAPEPAFQRDPLAPPPARDVVQLDVPMVSQNDLDLTDSAAIEMVFRYWGEKRYSSLEIARSLVWKFRENRRFQKSHTLFQIRSGKTAEEMDWSSYPGSGTGYVREFLEPLAPTDNPRVENLPANPDRAREMQGKLFEELKDNLNREIPVIVYQYVDHTKEQELFRVVTGYDNKKGIIYLNDPLSGKLEMSEGRFLELWNVKGPWLSYNSIVFNKADANQVPKGQLAVTLPEPES